MPISQLARGLFVELSTVTGAVDRLEQKGFVIRTRQRSDRRIVMIEITESGRELSAKAPSSMPRFLRKGMKELSEKEASTIVNALARLVDMLNKHRTLPQQAVALRNRLPEVLSVRPHEIPCDSQRFGSFRLRSFRIVACTRQVTHETLLALSQQSSAQRNRLV